MFKLYYKGSFISEHKDFADAEANARWIYFEFFCQGWEGYEMPPGFMIAIDGESEKKAA